MLIIEQNTSLGFQLLKYQDPVHKSISQAKQILFWSEHFRWVIYTIFVSHQSISNIIGSFNPKVSGPYTATVTDAPAMQATLLQIKRTKGVS